MRYRLTVLTPLLAGDGQRLSPIDYMIWRDQVNVLNQARIFKLLSRGPRLEPYLAQLRRAEKLDFASWGGFAQNYAGRRIPFEHASSTPIWNQTRAEHLHIPTFAASPSGAFLPGSVLKGALRTAYVWSRWNAGVLSDIAGRMEGERGLRRPGAAAETMTLGAAGADPMRVVAAGDSGAVPGEHFRVYLIRVASLQAAKAAGSYELTWKQAPRGSVPAQRVQDASASFAEMAVPGTEFSGAWQENAFLRRPEVARTLHWRNRHDAAELLRVANDWAGNLLATQRQYAETARLPRLLDNVKAVEAELTRARDTGGCIVSLGWGGGLLTKTAFTDTANEDYRRILRQVPPFAQAVRTGLPFPKTRKIVFAGGEPAAFPGWARLDIA